MKKAKYLILLPVMLALIFVSAMSTFAQAWDLAGDFTTVTNPNGAWSYGFINNATNVFSAFGFARPWSWAPVTTWSYGDGNGYSGSLGKNTNAFPVNWTGWGSSAKCWYIEAGEMFLQSGDREHLACCRWTAPNGRTIRINAKAWSQSDCTGNSMSLTVLKNGQFLAGKSVSGFMGTKDGGFTDSIGPAPSQSFTTVIDVASGDTVDFIHNWSADGWGGNPFVWKTLGISVQIAPGASTACSTIGQIKSASLGDTVSLTVPMPVTVANRFADNSLYIEASDRSSALKLIGDENTYVPEGYKITFTGIVIADASQSNGKSIQVGSINSMVYGECPGQLFFTSKSLNIPMPSSTNMWAKVSGKVVQIVPNTGADSDRWPIEYLVLNDGGQDVKIRLHVQRKSLNDYWTLQTALGDNMSVSGIVLKEGTQSAIWPRNSYDLQDYTQMGY